ncbi:hypothetical protein V6N12_067529 [Hibiscus sabdariffa]|uniref:C2 NT-type domain-containing protein n=1 Tax=Hibiscus sabdariffa TaxID=183260 RepID=A0ABR2B8A8_9ROSI
MVETPRHSFSDCNSRSESVAKAHPVELRRLLKYPNEVPSTPRKLKKYILGWKALKAFSNDKSRKFTCCFSLQVHSIKDLSIIFKELSLCVHWKRRDEDRVTRPVKVFNGTAEFEENLTITCSVYGTKSGPHNSVKYEVKHCLLYASVLGAPDLDLGKHQVDLARFLPLTWEELEEEKSTGEWTTSFKLSGKARGATMNVTFGYTILSDKQKNRKTGINSGNDDQKPTMRAVESLPCLAKTTSLSRFMDEMKELQDILPGSKSDTDEASVIDQKFDEYKSDDANVVDQKFGEYKPDDANVVDQKLDEYKPDDTNAVDQKFDESNVSDQKFDEYKPDDANVVDKKFDANVPDDANMVDQKFDECKPDDVNVVHQNFDEYKPDDASIASEREPGVLIEHFEPTLARSSVAYEPNEYLEKETEDIDFSVVDKDRELSSQEQVRSEEGSTVVVVPRVETKDPEFETFYTKNILLNEGIRAWMAAQDQPHENLIFPENVLPCGNAL